MISRLQKYSISVYYVVILGLLPLLLVSVDNEVYFQGKIAGAILTVLLTLTILFASPRDFKGDSHIVIVMTAIILLTLLSTWLSIDRGLSYRGLTIIPEGFKSLMIGYGCFFVGYIAVRRGYELSTGVLVEIVLICASIVSLIGLMEFFYIIEPISEMFGVDVAEDINYTTIGNRNLVGTYTVLMLPLAMWWTVIKQKLRGFIYTILIVALLVLSQTRSAYLAMIIIFIGFLFMTYNNPATKWWDFALMMAMLLFIGGSIWILINMLDDVRILERLRSLYYDIFHPFEKSAGSNRMEIWRNTMEFVAGRPILGSGPDTFGLLYSIYVDEIDFEILKAHNHWLQIMVTLGIPYLLTYLFLLVVTTGRLIKSSHKNAKVILLILVAYEFQGMFNVSVGASSFIYWTLLGSGAAMVNWSLKDSMIKKVI